MNNVIYLSVCSTHTAHTTNTLKSVEVFNLWWNVFTHRPYFQILHFLNLWSFIKNAPVMISELLCTVSRTHKIKMLQHIVPLDIWIPPEMFQIILISPVTMAFFTMLPKWSICYPMREKWWSKLRKYDCKKSSWWNNAADYSLQFSWDAKAQPGTHTWCITALNPPLTHTHTPPCQHTHPHAHRCIQGHKTAISIPYMLLLFVCVYMCVFLMNRDAFLLPF